ncbi:MAG TPA: polymer-forming cytoskeletal protein [Treponemataceae bacterium]|jgi:cytoskeletal protein CcmA (bactofilin family)|nr:polymer-forming cytoskeletal protein [Treponemataceae bacterium]
MAFNPLEDVSINTIIGPGSFIRGSLAVSGFIRVDGDIDGNLDTPSRVIIGEGARIKGNVRSLYATIGGVVQGDVIAPEGVVVLSSGMVLGSIITKRLKVDEDVILNGACVAVNDQARFDAALAEYNNRRALGESFASRMGRS